MTLQANFKSPNIFTNENSHTSKNDITTHDSNSSSNDVTTLKVLLLLDYCKYKNTNHCLKNHLNERIICKLKKQTVNILSFYFVKNNFKKNNKQNQNIK